ncbi:FCD domain-containing protein [Sphaerimonospora mesophila]|uniref:FadR/GntR family transcriptional regulator n=1 Tax=Sphaerimonospora mesophila TaxID=37483 RepID=UPI0006E14CB7
MRQLRQPRLAEIVAAKLRDDILEGRLTEGDSLPRQEHLFTEFRVSLPAVREAMRILETEGLVSVRRGNVGGAVVHLPTPQRIARTISMVLQTRRTTMADVSGALLHLEPTCVALCAERPDRAETTVPELRQVIAEQHEVLDDPKQYAMKARRFHEKIVETCGNETMIVIIGSLETIWTAHESTVWLEASLNEQAAPDSPVARKSLRAALRDHEKIVDAIEAGDSAAAVRLASAHLSATRRSSLESTKNHTVSTELLDNLDYGSSR